MASNSRAGHEKSRQLYARAKNVLPGGVSRNTILRKPNPIYVDTGSGCKVTDVDGNIYTDFAMNMASLIHGHAHPRIVEAVSQQLKKGSAFMLATTPEVEYAEHMCDRNLTFDKVRFMNSGTEAVMTCIKAARAFTGRPKIAKAEGAYHGLYDYAEVSQTSNPDNWGPLSSPNRNPVAAGTPKSALDDVVIIPFNDPERAIKILDKLAGSIACVLVDPIPHRVGLIPANAAYLKAVRHWTNMNGALLVLDEVVTFRASYGGAQEALGVKPDLTAMGKMIGGGFPVGAVAGRDAVMQVMDPTRKPLRFPQAGTFSANPITMTAGRVAMEMFDASEILRLNQIGERLRENMRSAIRETGGTFCVTGFGSMFRIHAKQDEPRDYREAYSTPDEAKVLSVFLDELLERGYLLMETGTGMLSTALNDATIDRFSQVFLETLRETGSGHRVNW